MENLASSTTPATPSEMKRIALDFVVSVCGGGSTYSDIIGGNSNLASTTLAVATRYMLGVLNPENLTDDDRLIADAILERENINTGAFEDISRDTPTSRRLDIPLCGWAIRALNMLGVSPSHPLVFMRRWNDAEELTWWLGLLEWHRSARRESHRVLNIGIPSILAAKGDKEILKPSVEAMFSWLDTHQDYTNGFWGTAQGAELIEGLGATFHILLLYVAGDREIPHLNKIVDTTLQLWDEQSNTDNWNKMASLRILNIAQNHQAIGRDIASKLAASCWDTLTFQSVYSLSDLVTRLEALRLVAEITDDDSMLEAKSWQSPWRKELWRCNW